MKRTTLRLLGNSAIYAIGGFAPQVANVLVLPIFTRYLSPAEYGILSYTSTVCFLFGLLGALEVRNYIYRLYHEHGLGIELERPLSSVFGFLCVYNVLLLLVANLTGPSVFRLAGIHVPFKPYMQLSLLSTSIEVIVSIPASYLRIRGQAIGFVGLSLASVALNIGLSLYLILGRGMGLMGRYYGQVGASAVLLIPYLLIMARAGGVSWNLSHIRKAISFSLPLVPAIFISALGTLSDRLVLERFVPLAELGIYSVALSLSLGVAAVTTGIYRAIEPRVYQPATKAQLDSRFLAYKGYLVWVLVALTCLVVAFSREVVTVFASSQFRESYKIVPLLSLASALGALTTLPNMYLIATSKTRYEPLVRFGGALTGIVFMLIMVPLWGVYGAGLAAILSPFMILCVYDRVIRRQSALRWSVVHDFAWMCGACLVGYLLLKIRATGPMWMVLKAVLGTIPGTIYGCLLLMPPRSIDNANISPALKP